MPDAGEFHKKNVNTLGHLSATYPQLNIPNLIRMGISHLTFMEKQAKPEETLAYFSRFRSATTSNDSLSVMWEMAGLRSLEIYQNYPKELPHEMTKELAQVAPCSFQIKPAMGIGKAIKKFSDEQIEAQEPLLFSTGNCDLVLSSHIDIFNEDQLFKLGQKIFLVLRKFNIGKLRIIPYGGEIGKYRRITNAETSLLERPGGVSLFSLLAENNIPVIADNRIGTAFNFDGFEEILPSENVETIFAELFQNLHQINTDTNGHALIAQGIYELIDEIIPNKDLDSYVSFLEKIDSYLPKLLRALDKEDILIITSLAGGDITSQTTGITREYLPFFFYSPLLKPHNHGNLGIRSSLRDIAETVLDLYEIDNSFDGESLMEIINHYS